MTHEDYIARLMAKADESLDAAQSLLSDGHNAFAASRTYYAMFYAAEAALLRKGLSFSKHAAVMAEFNRVFVKGGVFAPAMFKSLQLGFDTRSQGDYSILPVPRERAEGLLEKAREFVAAVREFLAAQA
ncbi:MAG: HEPN domain-containing protein [Planctomycetota bacterium]|jgi:uncharacterized protein (UPF0332 family)